MSLIEPQCSSYAPVRMRSSPDIGRDARCESGWPPAPPCSPGRPRSPPCDRPPAGILPAEMGVSLPRRARSVLLVFDQSDHLLGFDRSVPGFDHWRSAAAGGAAPRRAWGEMPEGRLSEEDRVCSRTITHPGCFTTRRSSSQTVDCEGFGFLDTRG